MVVYYDTHLSCIEDIGIAWRKGLRHALGLPRCTHLASLAPVTDWLPLRDELFCRTAIFVSKCDV